MARRLPARLIAGFLALLMLAACAGSGVLTWEPETDAERALREQAEALQATVGEGSLAGAVIGAALGAATGNVGAAFQGARLGQFAGAGAGIYLKALQSDFANREAQLEQISADLQLSIDEVEAALASMRAVLETQQSRIAQLEQSVAANAATQAQLQRERERAARNLAEMNKAIAGAEAREQVFAETRGIVVSAGDAPPAEVAAGEQVDGYLTLLADRIASMRDIAGTLANDI